MSSHHEPNLTDGVLRLRPLRADDAEAIYEAVRESIVELGQWLSWAHPDYTIADTRAFLERQQVLQEQEDYALAIADCSTGRLLGCIGINQIEKPALRGNLGYWVRTSAAGRGVATAATALLARWGFATLELERLEIVAATGNHASQRVAQKAGAVREGIARKRMRVHGMQHDAVVFSLVRGDLVAAR